jgi:ATP/ADP translocase
MKLSQRIEEWLNIRPNEVRNVALSFAGAFLVISFLILARALREALYLTIFDIETLPYMMAAVAILSIPTVAVFARLLARYSPKNVLLALVLVVAAGLTVILLLSFGSGSQLQINIGVVGFYLWTALGTLLLTSGFWVLTSEYFAVRGAKRLFGLIGAGGTAGAMVTGNSLVWLKTLDVSWLIAILIAIIAFFAISQQFLPKLEESTAAEDKDSSMVESLTLVWRSPHLRTIALIVFVVAIATTLLDYQFKEAAQARFDTRESLTSFFGAFYGWTGGIALLLQLALVARILAVAGVAWALAIVPLTLLFGSVGMLVLPSLVLVTAVRGADASLRKSLYRSALEVLFVPVPTLERRKTKTFIDSVIDSFGEGLGAIVILVWVTSFGFQSRYLSVFIIAASIALISFSRRMGRRYLSTVAEQLQQSGTREDVRKARVELDGRDLLSGTFTRLDIRSLIQDGEQTPEVDRAPAAGAGPPASQADAIMAALESTDLTTVARALEETPAWDERQIPVLVRLLARDQLFDRAALALLTAGEAAVPLLTKMLGDESTDFVVRRRIPRVLGRMGGEEADDALLDALAANRFEVRYRSAIALVRRRRRGLPTSRREKEPLIWTAVRAEVGRGRPVWEIQKLLDEESEADDLVAERVGARGELSLEHTFRLLSLVLEPEVVRAAFNGVILDDDKLKNFSLEFLEQVLPADVRNKLWPFIGDISERQREKSLRPLGDVVSDLMTTGATLFADEQHQEALKRILEEQED